MFKKIIKITLYTLVSLLLFKSIEKYVSSTDYFKIKKINIIGNNFVNNEIIYKLINNKINENIFNINLKEINSAINKNDYIYSSKVFTLFPASIFIEISEIVPIGIYKNNNKRYLLDINSNSIEANNNALNYYNVPIISNINNYSDKIKISQVLKRILLTNESLYLLINQIDLGKEEININLNSKTQITLNKNKTENDLTVLFEFIKNISEIKKITSYQYIDLTTKNQIIVKEVI